MRIGGPGGSVALVTGAASGLGRAAATCLHAAGATLVLVDTNQEAGKELADGGVGTFNPPDVTSETEAEEAVAQATALGPLRVLVNCAGGLRAAPVRGRQLRDPCSGDRAGEGQARL